MTQYFYLDYDIQKINKNDFICIYVLEFKTKSVFKIYKKYSDETIAKLEDLHFATFDIIDNNIKYVIKRDGKISLDINY